MWQQPTPEADAFIERINALPNEPGVSLDHALNPSLVEEEELRRLFATDPQNTRLAHPHVGLIDLFNAPASIRTARPRVVRDPEDLSAKYVLPVSEAKRRKEGTPCMVADVDEFKKNWAIFTEGSLSQLLDWNNVIAAGGSVLACLAPLEAVHTASKRAICKHYHSNAYPASDIDLFLWGLNVEQAEAKIKTIYEAVRDSIPWDVTCIRTKHTVSIHSQYPYRSVQIVLRLYQSPAEILAGFDIDAPCCAYDGQRVWTNPRAVIAMMLQCNTVDMTRRSPSYEVRLAKYVMRGFEVHVPDLKREEIDPTIYERAVVRMAGLARLLVLEKRNRRGRNLKGDLKEGDIIAGLEMNDYDVTSLHIPYGPGWDARRIDKLVYQTVKWHRPWNELIKDAVSIDTPLFLVLWKNVSRIAVKYADISPYSAFILNEYFIQTCPEPIDDDERGLQEKEDETYIRGRIKFIEENPGRQSISGSFNPIDDGEWADQAYLKPSQQLFKAIVASDRDAVQKLVKEGIDINQRDHVGRTSLHVAILVKATHIACDLIDAGARLTARLVDGRTPLHLAAQYNDLTLVCKLSEKSAVNLAEDRKKNPKKYEDEEKEKATKAQVDAAEAERPSSEDDWSSHDDDVECEEDENDNTQDNIDAAPGDIPEDVEDEPDIINVNEHEWDFGFTPLSYAVLFASNTLIEKLIAEGADINLPTKGTDASNRTPLHPLALTAIREDENEACNVAECLITAGANSSIANDKMWTILHSIVCSGKAKLLATVLRCDKHAESMLNFPSFDWNNVIFPVTTAVEKQRYGILAVMLSHNVKLDLQEEDITRAFEAASPKYRPSGTDDVKNHVELAYQPVESALLNQDYFVQLLLSLGAAYNIGLKGTFDRYASIEERRTILDWVEYAINQLSSEIKKLDTKKPSKTSRRGSASAWAKFLEQYKEAAKNTKEADRLRKRDEWSKAKKLRAFKATKEYLEAVNRLLEARGAKSWKEVYPDIDTEASPKAHADEDDNDDEKKNQDVKYAWMTNKYRRENVPQHLIKSYDELYQACFAGDDATIKRLCLPSEGAMKAGARPLSIYVLVPESSGSYEKDGFTPLFAAVAGGKWETTKLIMNVAVAQHHTEDPRAKTFKTRVNLDGNASDDSDSDSDTEMDSDSDGTVDKQETFVDVATQPSSIRSPIKPHELLDVSFKYQGKRGDLLAKAIIDNDASAFVRLANLYQMISRPLDNKSEDLLGLLLENDRPELLDEYIKRTGLGIDMEAAQKDNNDPLPKVINDKNKIYLGLNVHGKKRADLATKNDPDAATTNKNHYPLVWRAAKKSANEILKYLARERPLAAYAHYSKTHTHDRARWLERATDLKKCLPEWLGWMTSSLGESPLTAAITGDKEKSVKTLELLFELAPQLMSTALQIRIKLVGYTPLILAARRGCSIATIDLLFSKSLSPMDHDEVKGWNIYHYLASQREPKVFKHLLNKLPRGANEFFLTQQGKKDMSTPLHIAVKNHNKEIMKLILEYDKTSLLMRNIQGSMPFHISIALDAVETTQLFLPHLDAKALQTEDGVGNTPLEISSLHAINERLNSFIRARNQTPEGIDTGYLDMHSYPFKWSLGMVNDIEKEVSYLRQIIEIILPEERKKRRTKLVWELNTFATMIESRLKTLRPIFVEEIKSHVDGGDSDSEDEDEDEDEESSIDRPKMLQLVREAVHSQPANRQLIHVADVQKSVSADLKSAREKVEAENEKPKKEDGGLEDENDDSERKNLERSMVGAAGYIDFDD
ncbi:hypothetical protein NLJ89_g4078 [Agrocybe chaxingu]|uniref:Ankyrin repeat protein n=1 Tax=Agrocybe chaxingu TaxID=84603 RepID=A0A9W8K3R3_9AGAR|nr:hypothetical protein NLJ89_g4078 [Agrocybe chaxingu]